MNAIQRNPWRTFSRVLLLLTGLIISGCSLLWNAEPIETPLNESDFCGNQLDDDEDGLTDCFDKDCAWSSFCLAGNRPFELALCAYSETQTTFGFTSNSMTELDTVCTDREATGSFGGNRSVCGPANRGDSFNTAEYQLNDWNVIAETYCAQPEKQILDGRTCGEVSVVLERNCDAPTLVCTDDQCESFAVFLNGDRGNGSASGIVSRNLDIWAENTDFFEIDTTLQRMQGHYLRASASASDYGVMLACDQDQCTSACNMEMHLEPKTLDASGARLALRLEVGQQDEIRLDYEVTTEPGSRLFAGDSRPLSGNCGSIDLQTASLGYQLRIAGPFYGWDQDAQHRPGLVVSSPKENGLWEALCLVPWQDGDGVSEDTQYQLKYLRSGGFSRGKLLVDRVDVKRRKRTNGSRRLCGTSEIGIFQGSRTVCGLPNDTLERVFSSTRAFNSLDRRLVIARSPSRGFIAFEEVDGVLQELKVYPEVLPGLEAEFIGISNGQRSNRQFSLWVRNADGLVHRREVEIVTEQEGEQALVLRDDNPNFPSLNPSVFGLQSLSGPSTIFRSTYDGDSYLWIAVHDGKFKVARSVNGTTEWELLLSRASLFGQLNSQNEDSQRVLQSISGFEVPVADPLSTLRRMMLLTTWDDLALQTNSADLFTLVMDADDPDAASIFEHGAVSIEPVNFAALREREDCEGLCPLSGGGHSMSLSYDGALTVYAQTTIDEQFRPQEGPVPEAYCNRRLEDGAQLPRDKVWRRLFYRLK